MKKKLIGFILMTMLSLELAACGKEVVPTNYEDIETESERDSKIPSHLESDTGTTTETEVQSSEKKPNGKTDEVVLGGDFSKDYDGFEYLYLEELMTESTENDDGKKESQKLSIFIPDSEYASVNRDTAYTDELGVDFRVSLNPYFRYDQNDYLDTENLQYYLEDAYDAFYCTDYYNVQISQIQSAEDGTRAYVSYCYYDKWNDQYIPLFATYYLKRIDKDITVLVEVTVDLAEVTGKTKGLLKELESFYGFDIEWNEEEAKKMLDQFLANNNHDIKSFSTGYLLFDLPSDWDRDYDNEKGTECIFAPGGDAAFAGCMILVNREYLGSDAFDIADICSSEESMKEYKAFLQESWGDKVSNIEVTDYGKTCMGNVLKVSYQTKNGDYSDNSQWYTITDEDYVYSIEVIALPDCDVDVFTIAETILQNGVLK